MAAEPRQSAVARQYAFVDKLLDEIGLCTVERDDDYRR
jgi:hypothetical protein